MLIDFDHAICEDDKNAVRRFERTGTLPFMSINNLEDGKLEHSLLDDWESLLYILCWVGTYDWKKKDEPGSLKWTLNPEEDDPNDAEDKTKARSTELLKGRRRGHQTTSQSAAKAVHFASHTNSGVSMFTLQKEHDLEAEIAAQKIVDQNVPGVAIPRNEGARSRADEISGVVVSAFESYVASTPYHTRLVAQNNSGLAAMQSEKPDPFIDIGVFSDECKAIREMIRGKGRGRGKEKPKQCTSKIFRPPVRQIAPLKHTDKIPESAGAQDRIGIVLRVEGDTSSDSPYRGSMKLDYLRMLALIEAKRCNNSQLQQDAYAQLFKYSRHIYASRYDRRFLVNMALCEKDKLGYDPTLYFSRDEDRWEIKVHDDSA
ncbi:hypothetical protein EV178_006449, partial [Coemansia sp. RSA 1646]